MPRRNGGSRRGPHVSLICQSKSEHIIRDDDIADVDGRTLTKARLVASNGEARRQIKASGLKVNDVTVTDEKAVLKPRDVTAEGVIKLSRGRKNHALLKPV